MTEVPEHLLARSKAARAKATGDGDAGTPPATPGEAPGTGAAASAVEPAGGTTPAPVAAAAPVAEPPKPVPPYVAAAHRRPRVPRFAIPVLAALPVWALIYAGTMAEPSGSDDPQLELGENVYASACSGCHGADGQGGTGRPLGQVVAVFPDAADHIRWVENGSPTAGTPYGSPEVGRISQEGAWTAMPGFRDSLSPEEIAAVVRYEREHFGGAEPTPIEAGEETASAEEGELETGNADGDGGTATNEAEASGGNTSGENPSSSPGAGVDGDEGSGSDASPEGGRGDELEGGAG